MAGHTAQFNGGIIHISMPNIYRYKGMTFEWHDYCGAMLCKKDGEPSKRDFGRKTGKILEAWLKLPPSKRARTLIFS
jgi:hypothetical protein